MNTTTDTIERRELTHDEIVSAVRSLAWSGYGDHEIARITGLAVQYVRHVLCRGRQASA